MKKVIVIFFVITMCFVQIYAEGEHLTIDVIKFHYEKQGEGPAVILVHGWGVSLDSWHFLFPDLTDKYTVIRYDRRGFGKSEGIPNLSQDPADLSHLLKHLKIEKAVIIGHSQGAEVALRFVLSFPEQSSGLVLFGCSTPDGFGLSWNGPDAFPADMIQTAQDKGLDAMRALFAGHPLGNGFVVGTEGNEIMAKMFLAYEGKDLLNPQPKRKINSKSSIERLSEISVSTLVITGELEMPYFKIVSDALAYGITNSERVIVKGGGHSVMLQQPERFNAEIKRFLSKLSL